MKLPTVATKGFFLLRVDKKVSVAEMVTVSLRNGSLKFHVKNYATNARCFKLQKTS